MKKLFKGAVPTIALLLVAVMSLTSLTYAWFTAGNEATVDTVNVDVKDVDGLLVSANGYNGTWGSKLTPIFASNCNNKKLQDVSSTAELAHVDGDASLIIYNAHYDEQFDALTSATKASITDGSYANWYQFDVYIKNDGTKNKVVTMDGTTISGDALSRAIGRIAVVEQGTASAAAKLNENEAPDRDESFDYSRKLLGILEPNSTSHTGEGIAWLHNNGVTEKDEAATSYLAVKSQFAETAGRYINVATGDEFTADTVVLKLTAPANSEVYAYNKTGDTALNSDKTYYTTSNEGVTYDKVTEPDVANIGTYYEKVFVGKTFASTAIDKIEVENYKLASEEGEYDADATYYTKSGDVYTKVNANDEEAFATYYVKLASTYEEYYLFTPAIDEAAGEHFAALKLDDYFAPILATTEYMDGNGKAKAGVYKKESDTFVLLEEGVAEVTEGGTYYKLKETVGTVYTKAAGDYLKDITGEDNYFYDGKDLKINVEAGKIVKLTVFIWLEGQDCDCTNYVAGKPFTVDIKFKKAE